MCAVTCLFQPRYSQWEMTVGSAYGVKRQEQCMDVMIMFVGFLTESYCYPSKKVTLGWGDATIVRETLLV